ncbi:MAG TPA: YciI family protein [Pyrinomonadaceae bacterium]|nr:YciI family protein [Pyrinomonadaceae bacterium]
MKFHKSLFLFIIGLSSVAGFGQAAAASSQVAQSKFDADLAKKVGADKNGMRSYVLAILKTGPNDAKVQGDARKEIFKGHFANMNRLASEGKLAVAGPFNDPNKIYRGLFILAVSTVEEAKALAETDPTVKSGVLVVEYVPWYGSASLMLSNEFHEKVAEKNF